MSLSTLAEWTGSAIIGKLVEEAYSYLRNRMLPADTEADLQSLKAALPKITAVMGVAEALKFKYPNVNSWLEQFRQAFQAAEDVLDELKYRELEDMVQTRSLPSAVHSAKRKICEFFISKGTLRSLGEAVRNLDRAAADVGSLLHLALDVHRNFEPHREFGMSSSRETTSFLTESRVFGRETEKAKIIEWLRKPASQSHISVFCIVGLGGLGKTTLAQFIFQEISRENRFDKTVWVCVSTSFSVEDITRKILQGLGEESCGGQSLDSLQKKMKEKIQSKKVFFILDDVWNDDKMCDWQKLMAPLGGVQQEIKILITTRMKSVTDMVAHVLTVEREYLVLGGLEDQELLLLFNKYAFHGFNPDNHKDLQEMGNQRVKMLRGSPLLAKVIGSLLNSHMDFLYWKRILNSNSLIDMEKAKDVVDVLKLSYYHLPSDLQECFRFCCIFPQDYKFKRHELVKMWIASGFIRKKHCREERPEDIGEDYFNHLLKRCFFDHLFGKHYVMHDLMHDLARNTSIGECYRVESNDKLVPIPVTAQHVSIQASEIERILHLTNLRSLVISENANEVSTGSAQFVFPNGSIKKTLRLLMIGGGAAHAYDSCKLPEEIGHLIHLRYLYIGSKKCLLPDSTYKLHHLQVLKWYNNFCPIDCSDIQTTGINNLVNLRYMKLPNEVMRNISGVHKLTSLQKLTFFVGWQSGYHIDELNMLNNLRHLSINQIENVGRDPVEAMNANLAKKENLISLSLNWTEGGNSDNPELIIDNLQPNSNLKELTIKGYKGHRSPIWMRVSTLLYLSSLKLSHCPVWEDLPFIGNMIHLKRLCLIGMKEMKEVHFSFDSTRNACTSPPLEWLCFSDMPKLVSLAGLHACYGFPNLEKLEIIDCPNLVELPAMPLSLSKFWVDNVGLDSLPDICHCSSITPTSSTLKSSIREVWIRNCPNLKSLDGFLHKENLELQDFVQLIIENCVNLVQLPTGAFGKLVSLEELEIGDCPNLVTLPAMPLSLSKFRVDNVGLDSLPDICHSSSITAPTSSTLKSSIREVWIWNCPNLKSLNGFLQKENLELQDFVQLIIGNCVNLVLLPTDAFGKFGSLENLEIRDCPNLVKLPAMPLSLSKFLVDNVGLDSLPDICQSSSITALASSTLKSSIQEVCITDCPNLKSLNGFLQKENLELQDFVQLLIGNCVNMVQLPTGAFRKFVSLKWLSIQRCPKLVAVDNQGILLPAKLQSLYMGNCGEVDGALLESASGLTSLTHLWIGSNANITRIPSSENAFASLTNLDISKCDKLVELSSMEQAHGVSPGNNSASLKISNLTIGHLPLLLIEPLRSLRCVTCLEVGDCSGMEALPERFEQWLLQNSSTLKKLYMHRASSLRSLPGTMVRLTALEYLSINEALLLEELPELPTCLIIKEINGPGVRLL